ncbi:MAG: acyl transferase [Bacteroidetes bacterium]|nr:acyl transferase [Bacteroidota bacterium]
MHDGEIIEKIFSNTSSFNDNVLKIFHRQYSENIIYRQWCRHMKVEKDRVNRPEKIPFLPISFFKTHEITTGKFKAEVVFQSSGTTKQKRSSHIVKDLSIYRKSFLTCFQRFYGDAGKYCILALLPSYSPGSSLIMMVKELIRLSGHSFSRFYAGNENDLSEVLRQLESQNQPAILIGVSFALYDFAERFPQPLKSTLIMETGGMKGRKKEITRQELHDFLKGRFELDQIHSEYGMTELLSQAYAKRDGRFICPSWMKVLVRNEHDPLQVSEYGKGLLNIIDLANIYSCSFIATDDVGEVFKDGSFEVNGRQDSSDLRGCSLLLA